MECIRVFIAISSTLCIINANIQRGESYEQKARSQNRSDQGADQANFAGYDKKTVFEKIAVSELCKIAEINRGTFYLHYCDLWAVLEELEEEALQEASSTELYQCCLSAEHYECPYGICDKIHTHPEYGVIFFDDSLTGHVIEKIAQQSKDKYVTALVRQLDLTAEQAETIFYFQLNGCLTINKKIYRNGSKNWEASRDLIGGFIQSGLKRYEK